MFDFLKIPSISADPNYKNDVKKAANWIAKKLHDAGCEKVKIEKGSESKTLKYKKAESMLKDGWVLSN